MSSRSYITVETLVDIDVSDSSWKIQRASI